ncbi:hypothetical protein F5882DRAFT_370912, partial [Hyaloscypha sp. PMI_1271]
MFLPPGNNLDDDETCGTRSSLTTNSSQNLDSDSISGIPLTFEDDASSAIDYDETEWLFLPRLAYEGQDHDVGLKSFIVRFEARLKKIFPSGIKLLHNPEYIIVDIIFVHGLIEDREKTWTAKNAAAPWPKFLLPLKVPNARILTFGYDASVADWKDIMSRNRIENHSTNLLNNVATFRKQDNTDNLPIIFVCHSLGGLICEDALLSARQRPEQSFQNILNCTRGILFLGTPHYGSGLTNWTEKLAKLIGLFKQTNPQILAELQSDSEVLARVQDAFYNMVRPLNQQRLRTIEITCFYEELPFPGLGIVVPSHSAALAGSVRIGIRNNHINMTKFEDIDDPGFKAIAGVLCRWVREM